MRRPQQKYSLAFNLPLRILLLQVSIGPGRCGPTISISSMRCNNSFNRFPFIYTALHLLQIFIKGLTQHILFIISLITLFFVPRTCVLGDPNICSLHQLIICVQILADLQQANIKSMIEASNLEVKQVDQNSRGLFSKTEFNSWSTVLDCDPICVSVSASCRNKFCSFCLVQKQVSRCSQCKVPYYCSTQCQKEDWKVHKTQCSILKRMAQKNLDPSKINMEMQLNLRLWIIRNKNEQINKKVNQMCNLIEFQLPQRLNQFQQTAVMLIEMLQIERNEESIKDLIKQQSIVSLNSFTIQDYLCNEESVGLGLYWPANFINHHCHPNCSQIFDGRFLKIVANRKIEPGEQITISYVPALESWTSRQKLCREGYLFECFCQYCQTNKMFDQTLLYMKCSNCNNSNIVNKSKKKLKFIQKGDDDNQKVENDKKGSPEIQCLKCEKVYDEKQINEIISKANSYLQIIQSQNKGYQVIKKALLNLRKVLSDHDPRMKNCIYKVYSESLIEAQKDQNIYKQSYILLKEMLELVPKWYRLNPEDEIPYVYIWRYAELGKLAYLLQKMKKACQYTQKSYHIIKKLKFKNEFPEVKQLKQRYDEMNIGLSFNKAEISRRGQH